MMRSDSINAVLFTLVLIGSFNQVVAEPMSASAGAASSIPSKYQCPKKWLKENKKSAFILAAVFWAAYKAEPTQGNHETSIDMLVSDPVKWVRNVFGWFGKEDKIKVNKITNVLEGKPGYDAQGLVGLSSLYSKKVANFAALMFALKTIDPLCDLLEILGIAQKQ